METRFWTVSKILNPYARMTNQANLPEVETSKSLCWDDRLDHARGSGGSGGSGDAARSSEPGKHAHTFRMTLVAQGKLPQIRRVLGKY